MLTDAQQDLLKRLIEADRHWRTSKENGEYLPLDHRGIEVSWTITGVKMPTAQALVNAGLAETVGISEHLTYIFLGKYLPYDQH